MKEIDWSEAPEGTTHWVDSTIARWHRHADGTCFWWLEREKRWIDLNQTEAQTIADYGPERVVARPISPEWTGEGLPPVGTVCEYLFSEGEEWRSCSVVAHYEGRAVVCDLLDDASERVQERNLRPIRTPEQIAAEEREKAIDAMADLGCMADTPRIMAAKLYDAGYRKPEGGTP